MAWERRQSQGGRYFYRAERRDGKVVKTYIGAQTDPVVQFIARIDQSVRALNRLNHRAEVAEQDAERDRQMRVYDVRSAPVQKLYRRIDTMTNRTSQTKTAGDHTPKSAVNGKLPTQAEFLALVARAEKGGEKAQAELRYLLDMNPELWRPLGDLGNLVESHLVDLAARSNLMRESLRRRLAEIRQDLSNGGKGPLLGFLVHRVLVSWLEVEVRQIEVLQAQGEPANRKLQRRLDLALRRHGESVVALRDFQYFPFESDSGITPAAPFTDPTDLKPPTPSPG